MKCSTARLLYRLIPLKAVQNLLIHSHFGKCQQCNSEFHFSDPFPDDAFYQNKHLPNIDLWPLIEKELIEPSRLRSSIGKSSRLFFQIMMILVFLIIIILTVFILMEGNAL